jgi:hypothetical protein
MIDFTESELRVICAALKASYPTQSTYTALAKIEALLQQKKKGRRCRACGRSACNCGTLDD